jgi:hypothetical protein
MNLAILAFALLDCGGGVTVVPSPGKEYAVTAKGGEGQKAVFAWLEGGQRKQGGELKLGGHYDATLYVSPLGTGFLVYCPNQGNDLLSFYSPAGERVSAYGWEILAPEERDVERIACCGPTLGMAPPKLSEDGRFCDLRAPVTGRSIRIFLPAGRIWDDLLRIQLASIADPPAFDLAAVVKELDSDSGEAREKAVAVLRTLGASRLDAIEKEFAAARGEIRARLGDALRSLRPLRPLLARAGEESFRKSIRP